MQKKTILQQNIIVFWLNCYIFKFCIFESGFSLYKTYLFKKNLSKCWKIYRNKKGFFCYHRYIFYLNIKRLIDITGYDLLDIYFMQLLTTNIKTIISRDTCNLKQIFHCTFSWKKNRRKLLRVYILLWKTKSCYKNDTLSIHKIKFWFILFHLLRCTKWNTIVYVTVYIFVRVI